MSASRTLVCMVISLVLGLLVAVLLPGLAVAHAQPGIPQSVAVTAGDGSAVVQWIAPDDDGGETISSYTVTALPGDATTAVFGVARVAIVTGLSNGVAYRFTVTASNRA